MSLARSFGELFIPSPLRRLSLYTRLALPLSMAATSIASTVIQNSGVVFAVYSYAVAVAAMYLSGILRKALAGLALPAIFIAMGFAIHLLSKVLGYPTPPIHALALSSAKVTLIFIYISMLVQWLTFREIRYLLHRVGLGKLGLYLTLSLAMIPLLSNLYWESLVSATLKFGRRRAYKAVKPLVVQAAIIARDYAQALHLYGFPGTPSLEIAKPSALEAVSTALAIAAAIAALVFLP